MKCTSNYIYAFVCWSTLCCNALDTNGKGSTPAFLFVVLFGSCFTLGHDVRGSPKRGFVVNAAVIAAWFYAKFCRCSTLFWRSGVCQPGVNFCCSDEWTSAALSGSRLPRQTRRQIYQRLAARRCSIFKFEHRD
jgi:hypothetical protein